MHECKHTSMCAFTHLHIYVCIYIYTHIYIHTCVHKHINIHNTHIHVYMHTHVGVHTLHTLIPTHMCMHTAYMYGHTHVYAYMYAHAHHMYMYVYIHNMYNGYSPFTGTQHAHIFSLGRLTFRFVVRLLSQLCFSVGSRPTFLFLLLFMLLLPCS